jgi:small subunit ribosomal protein S17
MEQMKCQKTRRGVVVSDKMDKTVVVRVERLMKHPQYHKTIRRSNKFKAHDEQNACREGDIVEIVETRPLSKDKRWRVTNIVRKAEGSTTDVADAASIES